MAVRGVSSLNGAHAGEDIYVVGTGTSLRVFPLDFLDGKITIGLNRAWELLKVRYCISMVPHLNFPELLGKPERDDVTWITKYDKYNPHATPEQLARAERDYYFFRTDGKMSMTLLDQPSDAGRMLEWVARPTDDFLYLWTSISQSAVNLAANMGARNIILVGCDNGALEGNHHAHDQHTLWKGADPQQRYLEYYEGLAEIRATLRARQVNVLSATPFLKIDAPGLDFRRLCGELEKPEAIASRDIYQPYSLGEQNRRFLRLAGATARLNIKAARKAVLRTLRR